MSLLLALSAMPAAQAYDIHVASGYYNYSGPSQRSVFLTYANLENNLDAYSGEVIIPATINYGGRDIPVKGVGDHAMFNCQFVEKAVFPEGVTYILDQALSHCYYMTELQLPESLEKIGDYAFEFCEDLTTVTIPAKVEEFGYGVFSFCKGIQEYKVAEGNPVLTAHDGALFAKGGKTLVQYPAAKAATDYVVPAEVTAIADYAFSPAPQLVTITIGDAVEEIQPSTFSQCEALQALKVSDQNAHLAAVDGVLFTKDMTTLLSYPVKRDGRTYEVPEGVTTLADMAFANVVYGIYSLTLPESLTSVGAFCMQGSMPTLLTVNAHVPPTADLNPFPDAMYAETIVYVNEADLDAYRNDPVWGRFAKLRAIGTGGLDSIEQEASAIRVEGNTVAAPGLIEAYSADGRIVASGYDSLTLPAHGLYIIKTAGQTLKAAF